MRITDAMMSLPPLVLALAIASAIGGGLKDVIISLGIAMVPGYCRLMCGQVLSIRGGRLYNRARATRRQKDKPSHAPSHSTECFSAAAGADDSHDRLGDLIRGRT